MNDISKELLELLERYELDTRAILRDYSRLDYLYALSDMRENLLEWYPFRNDGSLLQIGADYGAMTGLYSQKVQQVVVLDSSADNLDVCRMRNRNAANIGYEEMELLEYAKQQSGDEGKRFDYVVLIGSLEPDYQAHIMASKMLLKPGGELILAVANPLGIKYWAGVEQEAHGFSKKSVTEMLMGEEAVGMLEFYYPVPDYRLAFTVYSQSYLPGKGDLTKVLKAYDYPKYLMIDMGAAFDTVCEDGQFENFANSFLVIWRNHDSN